MSVRDISLPEIVEILNRRLRNAGSYSEQFVKLSQEYRVRMQQYPAQVEHFTKNWFKSYVALKDEIMFIIQGAVYRHYHFEEDKIYKQDRDAETAAGCEARFYSNFKFLSKCSCDGVKFAGARLKQSKNNMQALDDADEINSKLYDLVRDCDDGYRVSLEESLKKIGCRTMKVLSSPYQEMVSFKTPAGRLVEIKRSAMKLERSRHLAFSTTIEDPPIDSDVSIGLHATATTSSSRRAVIDDENSPPDDKVAAFVDDAEDFGMTGSVSLDQIKRDMGASVDLLSNAEQLRETARLEREIQSLREAAAAIGGPEKPSPADECNRYPSFGSFMQSIEDSLVFMNDRKSREQLENGDNLTDGNIVQLPVVFACRLPEWFGVDNPHAESCECFSRPRGWWSLSKLKSGRYCQEFAVNFPWSLSNRSEILKSISLLASTDQVITALQEEGLSLVAAKLLYRWSVKHYDSMQTWRDFKKASLELIPACYEIPMVHCILMEQQVFYRGSICPIAVPSQSSGSLKFFACCMEGHTFSGLYRPFFVCIAHSVVASILDLIESKDPEKLNCLFSQLDRNETMTYLQGSLKSLSPIVESVVACCRKSLMQADERMKTNDPQNVNPATIASTLSVEISSMDIFEEMHVNFLVSLVALWNLKCSHLNPSIRLHLSGIDISSILAAKILILAQVAILDLSRCGLSADSLHYALLAYSGQSNAFLEKISLSGNLFCNGTLELTTEESGVYWKAILTKICSFPKLSSLDLSAIATTDREAHVLAEAVISATDTRSKLNVNCTTPVVISFRGWQRRFPGVAALLNDAISKHLGLIQFDLGGLHRRI